MCKTGGRICPHVDRHRFDVNPDPDLDWYQLGNWDPDPDQR
jgi:hypothetical protein